MIKQTLRQAWTMMKQHRLFTAIYITGTAVSIAIIMTLFIVIYINLGSIYPEYHRNEILLLDNEWHKYNSIGGSSNRSGYFNLDFAEALESESKHMKAMAVYDWNTSKVPHPITVDGNNVEIEEEVRFVSDGWWQVFDYKFVDGKGFTEKEMHENVAVVSESLAMQLFASTNVAGREKKINGEYFVSCVKQARQYQPSKDYLCIISGACFSSFKDLINNGSNISSSPGNVSINVLDPAKVAILVATTSVVEYVDMQKAINLTSNKNKGMGGIDTKGLARKIY